MDKIFDDFLVLLNTKREDNSDIEQTILDFCKKYPNNTRMSHCSNDTFSSSWMLLLKETTGVTKIVYFDQHNKDAVVINLHKFRVDVLISNLKALQEDTPGKIRN